MTEEVTIQGDTTVSFLKGKHELHKLLKSLDKASQAAVEMLTKTMDDVDVERKLRQQAAEKIIDFYLATSKQVNDDELSRLIAEVKLGGKRGVPLADGTGNTEKKKPALEFGTIRTV